MHNSKADDVLCSEVEVVPTSYRDGVVGILGIVDEITPHSLVSELTLVQFFHLFK